MREFFIRASYLCNNIGQALSVAPVASHFYVVRDSEVRIRGGHGTQMDEHLPCPRICRVRAQIRGLGHVRDMSGTFQTKSLSPIIYSVVDYQFNGKLFLFLICRIGVTLLPSFQNYIYFIFIFLAILSWLKSSFPRFNFFERKRFLDFVNTVDTSSSLYTSGQVGTNCVPTSDLSRVKQLYCYMMCSCLSQTIHK